MKHLLFDLIDCPPDLLDDEDFVRLSAWNAAKESKSELINISCHKFDPQGVTALAMLAESHLSIHTWPCLLYTSPSPRDVRSSRMPSSA